MSQGPRVSLAEFITSAPSLSACPEPFGPEVAVAGRSNVGKSSLLNLLTGRKKLATVSSTPGRTRLLNFFRVEFSSGERLGLVDLPGYGFAKVSEAQRKAFGPMIEGYLFKREALAALVLLIDIRRDPKEEERQVAAISEARQIPLIVVATKSDELPKAKRRPRLEALREALHLRRLPVATSAMTGEGREAVWAEILAALPKPEPEPPAGPQEPGD